MGTHTDSTSARREHSCRRCGKPIPERLDPRGRPVQWCSGACRAAASRERREREHQAALEQARTQAVLTLRTRSEELSDATRVVRELTHDLVVGRELGVSVEHHDLIAAIRDFADVMDVQTVAAAPTLNRAQRRTQKRRR